ncbi:unnamed protein product [Microthlaspi erraticum]|uniref:Uncharacterized protein n=1 Tax=Microthlaspi erraticum TaxID=1685480 RepID=A0A6D2KYP0_9BRAS|nr:unnamed protein product [Microthlaspi erraticum]
MWRRNYTDGLIPVRGSRFWPATDAPDVHVPPPKEKPAEEETGTEAATEPGKEAGKKKLTKADKTRKKGVNESPTKKQRKEKQRIMHCGVCGEANHNARHHKANSSQTLLLEGPQSHVESSQGTLTQD